MITNSFYFNLASGDEIEQYAKKVKDEYQSGKIGYYHLPDTSKTLIDDIKKYEATISDIKNIVLVGIGGSSLGVKAIKSMLGEKKRKLYFLDNVDANTFNLVCNNIKFNQTIFIISSKSGTTIETITLLKCILNKFNPSDLSKNFIIITDTDTPLERFAIKNNIKFYNMPKNVGGRFSVLSAIGIVPLGLCGYDIEILLDGAKACQDRYIHNKNNEIIAKAYHYATHRKADINVLFSYSDRLKDFNDWYVQLWAESLGKKHEYKRIGRTPIGLIGSTDQHSFLQLIMDGVKDKTVTFIKIKNSDNIKIPNISLNELETTDFVNNLELNELLNAQCDATKMALVQEGLSVDTIQIECLNEYSAGYLIYYYELLTSATGIILDINTYDQPGVEIGKRILKTIIKARD